MQSKYPVLQKIDCTFIKLSELLAVLAGIVMMVIATLLFADVVASKLLSRNIPHVIEIATNFHIPIVYLTLLAVQLTDSHANVELIYKRFPYVVKKICFLLWDVFGIVVCGLETYVAFNYALTRFQLGTLSGVTSGFPLWPIAAIMALGWLLMGLGCLWSIIRTVTGLYEIPSVAKSVEKEEPECN